MRWSEPIFLPAPKRDRRAPTPGPVVALRSATALACLLLPMQPGSAENAPPFDLTGPTLRITVTRGDQSLPIAQVPSLAEGDKVAIAADLPTDQGAHFLMLSAFLRGATNPPPKKWIAAAETWKPKEKANRLALTIPKGARQLVLFLVPETKGAAGAISGTVRNRPGEFVRATQELNQASLDRSRLNTFMAAISSEGNVHPEALRTVAPRLARSLSMKLNADCLSRVVELQASCLLENRDSLVLGDMHSSSVAETIAGAPTDLALQVATTREMGEGLYSPYIGVVRDIARIFGAFGNPDLVYLPALGLQQADGYSLVLNRAPSFGKPRSVIVSAMPVIEADSPPRLRRAVDTPICATRPDLSLPVDGAPLIYSTAYSRNMVVTLSPPDAKPLDLPVEARADVGGYVFTGAPPAGLKGSIKGKLHGYWGFRQFDGPEFTLQYPGTDTPRIADDSPVLLPGSDEALSIEGAVPACIDSIQLVRDQPERRSRKKPKPLIWKTDEEDDNAIAVTLPLKDAKPGAMTLEIRYFGVPAPVRVPLIVQETAPALLPGTVPAAVPTTSPPPDTAPATAPPVAVQPVTPPPAPPPTDTPPKR
ncbi:MAG TPA: hypothetical protein VF503_21655 [Sphingobium sp.]|uniref:hypothetical protein n=1 Tax=Sphingobium sp. TaxID=1912891 RepID=UPI002ED460D9